MTRLPTSKIELEEYAGSGRVGVGNAVLIHADCRLLYAATVGGVAWHPTCDVRPKGRQAMSKHINMTGHYKVAGRERQGEDILQSSEKGAYAQQRQEARLEAIASQAGPPAWETTPPNLEITDRPKPPAKKKSRKSARPRVGKRTRKAAPRRKAARATSRPARRSSGSSTGSRRISRARLRRT